LMKLLERMERKVVAWVRTFFTLTLAAAFHRSVIRAASRDLISKKHRLDLFPAPAAHSLGEQRNPLGSTAKESRGFSVWIYDLMLLGKSVVYSI
jgi:hypothetical protein